MRMGGALVRSLAARVALASALAAALGGTLAALSTGLTTKALVSKQEKRLLRSEARELAKEVLEELEDDDDDDDADERAERRARAKIAAGLDGQRQLLERVLAHELSDVKLPGALAVIRAPGRVLAGRADLPAVERGECELVQYAGSSLRACSVPFGAHTLTLAAGAEAERERDVVIVRALLLGLLLGALCGGAFSYFISRWALSPLMALRDRVRAMPSDEPDAALLGSAATQSEVEELRAAIASLVERLGAALKQAQSFAAEAAHELRTPLTTIAGELELYAESDLADPKPIARVRTQVAGLTELVQRLLVLAQPGRLAAASAELVDLSDVLRTAEAAFPMALRERLHASAEDDVVVRGDASLLCALLVNALDNALKFSDQPVTVKIERGAQQARIEVIDRGPGIAEAERERVFMPFYRSPSVRASGTRGHGIGLALIARVAWAHQGRVELLPCAQGTHLCICLPLWNAKED